MFSCVEDSDHYTTECSLRDSDRSVACSQRALQTKCTRLSRLLEETEVQRCRDHREHERELAAARRDYEAQLTRATVQRSLDAAGASAVVQQRLAVAESEVVYWRSKFEHLRDPGQIQGQRGCPPASSPTVRSLRQMILASSSREALEPLAPTPRPDPTDSEWYSEAGDGESIPSTDVLSTDMRLQQAQRKAAGGLRMAHLAQSVRLRKRLAAAGEESTALLAEIERLRALLAVSEETCTSLRGEVRDLQLRLQSTLCRDMAEAKARQTTRQTISPRDETRCGDSCGLSRPALCSPVAASRAAVPPSPVAAFSSDPPASLHSPCAGAPLVSRKHHGDELY